MKPIDKPKVKKITRLKRGLKVLGHYFKILPDKEKEVDTIAAITQGIVFRGAHLWVLIFAILIASLGLNVNSTAVIIGAMLISPIMGPILGAGLALGIKDYVLLKCAVKNYGVATLISVATATLYFLISPFEGAQSELLARTSPTLYDVLIAFFGGMAGVVAICTRSKGNVIPGVAIATALMPPLCTAGYGLATAHWSYFFGAFYLFFINTIFIGLATFLGVKLLRFRQIPARPGRKYRNWGRVIALCVVLSLIPATVMTYKLVRESFHERNVRRFIKNEMAVGGTQIIMHEVDYDKKQLELIAVGRVISPYAIKEAKQKMEDYHLEDFTLEVVQGERSDSVINQRPHTEIFYRSSKADVDLLKIQSEKMVALESELQAERQKRPPLVQLKDEVKVLFPEVETLGVSEDILSDSKVSRPRPLVFLARLSTDSLHREKVQNRLYEWLNVRLPDDSIQVVVVPAALSK